MYVNRRKPSKEKKKKEKVSIGRMVSLEANLRCMISIIIINQENSILNRNNSSSKTNTIFDNLNIDELLQQK